MHRGSSGNESNKLALPPKPASIVEDNLDLSVTRAPILKDYDPA
jgi:hypothetical protein